MVQQKKAAIFLMSQTKEDWTMFLTKQNLAMARTVGVAIVAAVGLGGCATYKEEFATINSRLDSLDAKVQSAAQSAESANQSAQQANQSAQQANQRLDQLETRVQQIETAPRRKPRG
jgi:murein lipoprotein